MSAAPCAGVCPLKRRHSRLAPCSCRQSSASTKLDWLGLGLGLSFVDYKARLVRGRAFEAGGHTKRCEVRDGFWRGVTAGGDR